MSYEVKKLDKVTPEVLFGLLHRKHLLSLPVRNNPALLANLALNSDFHVILDGDQTVAWLIESRTMEPGVLDLALIPEDKTLCLHAGQLSSIAEQLRERWFHVEHWEKVQVQVPKSRNNACRALRAMGFVCETRSIGIRRAITLGKEAEALMIYGLLEMDPIPMTIEMMEEAHA